MSLTDNSLASKMQTQCWKDNKDLAARRICRKCGIIENCTITKEYDRDQTTIRKYVLNCTYEYRENTLGEGEVGVCRKCTDVYFKGAIPTKTSNRPEIQKVFDEINRTLAHDLFLLTSETDAESLPAYRKKLRQLQLEKEKIDERLHKALRIDKEQVEFLEQYPNKFQQLSTWIKSQEGHMKQIERQIDVMIDQAN